MFAPFRAIEIDTEPTSSLKAARVVVLYEPWSFLARRVGALSNLNVIPFYVVVSESYV